MEPLGCRDTADDDDSEDGEGAFAEIGHFVEGADLHDLYVCFRFLPDCFKDPFDPSGQEPQSPPPR